MWTTPTSFGSAPPLSASEFGAFGHGFFNSAPQSEWWLEMDKGSRSNPAIFFLLLRNFFFLSLFTLFFGSLVFSQSLRFCVHVMP
jgi:hypothetical protein